MLRDFSSAKRSRLISSSILPATPVLLTTLPLLLVTFGGIQGGAANTESLNNKGSSSINNSNNNRFGIDTCGLFNLLYRSSALYKCKKQHVVVVKSSD